MKRQSIIEYFIKMLIAFLLIDSFLMIAVNITASSSLLNKYGEDVIVEMFYALSVLIVMLMYHNFYVFTEKKEKFFKSITLGGGMLIISLVNFAYASHNLVDASLDRLLNVFILCIFVGIAEEFLCRGWIQNEFIERFSRNKNEVVLSIVLSSLIFGFMHIVNITSQNYFETILQMLNAFSLGILLGSIYYKAKNIWACIFLHALYDFSIYLNYINTIKDCTYNIPSVGVVVVEILGTILMCSFWILCSISILNKIGKKRREYNRVVDVLIPIVLVLLLIPFEKLVKGYEEYEVCYKYEEIGEFDEYTISYPKYDSYVFKSGNNEYYNEEDSVSRLFDEDNYEFEVRYNKNNTINIINNSTKYEILLNIKDIVNMEVIESDDEYILVIQTSENESTIYYSDYFKKNSMSNDDEYLDNITFYKFDLPEIGLLGYIKVSNEYTYPYMVSTSNDRFVIVNNELYLIKN